MTRISQIRRQIDELSERRRALWAQLSTGLDSGIVEEIRQIDEELTDLWNQDRLERARIRFGERDEIVRRARAEERLERAA